MASVVVNLELKAGPVFRTAMDVLEYCEEMLAFIPADFESKREELKSRGQALVEIIRRELPTEVGQRIDANGRE